MKRRGNLLSRWLYASLMWCLSSAPLINAEEYVVGVEMIDYKPYYFLENGQYKGFARELFDGFSSYSGHKFTYRSLPINRLYQEFRAGKIDFKFPDNPNWGSDEKRGLDVGYSAPVVGFVDGVLTKSLHDCSLTPLTSLGYVRGFTPWPYLDQIESGELKGVQVNSLSSLLKMAGAGRVEAAFVNVTVAKSLMKDLGITESSLVFSDQCPHDASNYLLSSHQHKQLITSFNDYLQSEAVETLLKSYQLEISQ